MKTLPPPPKLTDRQKSELKEKVKHASDKEIGKMFMMLKYADPFYHPKNRLLLPSLIRTMAINQINKWIDSGDLSAEMP